MPDASPGLHIPWVWLTVGLCTVAVSAIGTLAVVAKRTNADTLSTIALALAVLAFAAQLIVSLAQGVSGSQLVAQVERVNTDTQSALASIRASSDALLVTQQEQFRDVLNVAIEKAKGTIASTTDIDSDGQEGSDPIQAASNVVPEAGAPKISEAVLTELLQRITGATSTSSTVDMQPTDRYVRFDAFPTRERAQELTDKLRNLSPWAAQILVNRSKRAKQAALRGRTTETRWQRSFTRLEDLSPPQRELIDKGLIRVELRTDPDATIHLYGDITDEGIEVANLLQPIALADQPDWFKELQASWSQ